MSLTVRQILALKSLPGVGKQSILKIGNYCTQGIEIAELPEILAKCAVKMKNPDGKGKVPITIQDINAALGAADEIIEKSYAHQIGIVSYYDPKFPARLRNTKTEDGKRGDPPIILFYKGNLGALNQPGLAIIGSRKNTIGAEKAGLYLSTEFSRRGFCIVSGLALGCDTIGHLGALKAGGKTIAFLGHGLDIVYPPQNKNLAQEIIQNGGLLLSEYDIGTPVTQYNLVARDRLQIGLSLATLIIQTGIKGGTMHAAMNCVNAGKPLYVIKYADEKTDRDEKTLGNHLLVNEYGATYIRGSDNLDDIARAILQSADNSGSRQPLLTPLI